MRKKIMIIILTVVLSFILASYYTFYPNIMMKSILNENISAIKIHLTLRGGINRFNHPKIRIFENYTYHTPFTYACSIDSKTEILELLIDSGAEMEGDDWHFSGMYYLLTNKGNNNIANVELLLEKGFDPNYVEYYEKSLLVLSIEKMQNENEYDSSLHNDLYNMLLRHGATQSNEDIFTIISTANIDILYRHIENSDLDINITNAKGQTALMLVSGANPISINADIVRVLLDNNANVLIKDLSGKSALDYAITSGNQEIIELLSIN